MEETGTEKQPPEFGRFGRYLGQEVLFGILQKAPYGVVLMSRMGDCLYLNPEFTRITGYVSEDVPSGKEWMRKAYPDRVYRAMVASIWNTNVKQGWTDRVFQVTCKDGVTRTIEFRWSVLDDGSSAITLNDITEQERIQRALRDSEEQFRVLFENAKDAIFITTREGSFVSVNKAFLDLFGFSDKDAFEGNALSTYVNPDDRQAYQTVIEDKGSVRDFEVKLRKQDGTVMDCLLTASIHCGRNGEVLGYQGIIRDVTAEKTYRQNLAKSHKTMRDIIEKAPIGIYIVNRAGGVDYINPEMCTISGAPLAQLKELNVFELESYKKSGLSHKIRMGLQGKYFRLDSLEFTSMAGKTTMRNFIGVPFEESDEPKLLMFVEDITRQKFNELQLAYLATHDTLTGLPNRTLFNDRLTIALASAHRYRQMAAVMLFDLDRFKEVNDTLGHSVGDSLLKAVGDRITRILRQSDTIARMGGDEFFVLLPPVVTPSDADLVAKKILDVFSEPFHIDDHEIYITCSLGVAIYPQDGTDPGDLIRRADIAMYEIKKEGRNGFRRYIGGKMPSRKATEANSP